MVREPGATDVGLQLREILLTGHANKMDGVTEALLFSADRRHTVRTLIRPAMEEGKYVLSDRTYLTTLVFQGYARGLSLEMLENLTQFAIENTRPNLMIVLDLPVEISLQRKAPLFKDGLNEDRFESIGTSFHQLTRKGYLAEVEKNPQTHLIVNANQSPAQVHADILAAINGRFNLGLQPVLS